MLRQRLPAAALLGAALVTSCAQTSAVPLTALTVRAELAPGWRPFSADSPWNTPIPADARIDPKSDVLVADLGATGALYVNMPEWSVMVKYFDSSQAPHRRVRALYAGRHGPGFEPGQTIPIPADALAPETPVAQSNYFTRVDPIRNLAWDMRQSEQAPDGEWYAGFGAAVDLSGTGAALPWMKAERADMSGGARPSGDPAAGRIDPRGRSQGGPHRPCAGICLSAGTDRQIRAARQHGAGSGRQGRPTSCRPADGRPDPARSRLRYRQYAAVTRCKSHSQGAADVWRHSRR